MALVTEHTVRVLHQEIDTIQTIPFAPDHVLVGTYSLIRKEGEDPAVTDDEDIASSSPASTRVGSLQVLAINHETSASNINDAHDVVTNQNLPFSVLDIRFCPHDDNLLCAATSAGQLYFLKVTRTSHSIKLQPFGVIKLYHQIDDENNGQSPLITQFAWIKTVHTSHDPTGEDSGTYHLATCDTTGQTNLVKVKIPRSASQGLPSGEYPGYGYLPCQIHVIHKHLHDLEAWAVSVISLPGSPSTSRQILLSGGDDNCFIASTYILDLENEVTDPSSPIKKLKFETLPIRFWLDKQTHTAGVVAIFPLPQVSDNDSPAEPQSTIPILTGSYDEHLRLLLFDSTTFKFTLASEFLLEGGVWRINLIDSYTTSLDPPHTTKNYVLLVSAMHAGAYIIRLTETFDVERKQSDWSWNIEARFTEPHESMVYACTATNALDENGEDGTWTIISTSFYDKRLCVWKWKDVVESGLAVGH